MSLRLSILFLDNPFLFRFPPSLRIYQYSCPFRFRNPVSFLCCLSQPCSFFGRGVRNRTVHLSFLWQYLDLNKPLYERRLAIISGTAKPTPAEIQAGEEQSLKDDPTYEKLATDSSDTAPIPEFWLTALRNHVGTSDIITDRDAAALKHLIDIRVTYTTPKPGFKLTFIFTPNEFFENEELEKTYYYQEEVGYSGDFLYDRAIGTVVRWKEEKDLTKEFEIKKQRNKSACEIPLSPSFAHRLESR